VNPAGRQFARVEFARIGLARSTRSMIRPTVSHEIRISSQTALFEQCVASQAT
jgi:hypothetical protein